MTRSPRTRVLLLLRSYPKISQTYMLREVEAVWDDYDVRILSTAAPKESCHRHPPCEFTWDPARMRAVVEEFRPHVLHTHFLGMASEVAALGAATGIPYTVRTHSFDTLRPSRIPGVIQRFRRSVRALNDERCLGALAFPFARPLLERIGVRPEKIVECFPVVDYARFHDPSPCGEGVLNLGAFTPNKDLPSFIDLARSTPGPFRLYALGGNVEPLREYNEARGAPLELLAPVEPDEMPAVYKAHGWLVYTARRSPRMVGWPMAVAEAQASGLGVCFPNLGPDVVDYVGEGGFLYDSLADVPAILRRPYPEEKRQAGFAQAARSDIARHKTLLTDLWDRARNR